MASSSTSSNRKSFKYEVYLTFCGEDTRRNFVDHLYAALERQGIRTYMDQKDMFQQETKVNDEVIRSIQESKRFIIVFSKSYASSYWCLDVLAKIMECHGTTEQTAYSVFYDVEPSEIRKQSVAIGEAFAKHSREDATGNWRRALQEAADLKGWDLRNGYTKVIQKIVAEILAELSFIYLSANENLIGMEARVQNLLSYLETGAGDVHMIGIKGVGGVGKTTLAASIFSRISSQFEGECFVENVREEAHRYGLKRLQGQVLSKVLDEEGITISSVSEGKNMIATKLGDRKVLVVLDDVDQIDQLEALAGAPTWFGKGSVIIITTRDEKLLIEHGVNKIHHVDVLSGEEALRLFSRFAFGGDIPVRGYEELALDFIHYAAGLPLSLKVLGSFLCGKSKCEWLSVLERLKIIPEDSIMKQLKISFDSLEDDQQQIFLDVACFMKGLRKDDAIRILESCGFQAINGLVALKQKSLITISNERLSMHDLLEDMGRNIVRGECPNQPNKQTRLWILKEIEQIVANDLGTKATTCIGLPEQQVSPNILMKGFQRMEELRCLIVESKTDNDDLSCDWEFDEAKQYFPNALQFLRWVDYPARSLPETFRADNLVALEMPCSNITQLWGGAEKKVLHYLRFLDLSYSKLETLDLGMTPKIEWIELKECHDLVELHTPVGCLERLVQLNLIGCSLFKSFPFIKRLESLGVLSLSKLNLTAKSLPDFPRYANDNLPNLCFTCFYFEELPSVIRYSQKFVSVNLQPCTKLESVSGSICCLQYLRQLTFSGCIPEVPRDLDQLAYLEKLNLVSTRIKCLPDSICRLKHLKAFKLKSCQFLERLPEGLGRLESLEKLTLLSTRINRLPDSICMLKHLRSLKLKPHTLKSTSYLEKLPEDIGELKSLEKLDFLSARIRRLPDSICMLKNLKSLELRSCGLLEKLPGDLGRLESLEKLNLTECISLEDIPNSICNLKCLKDLNLERTGISHLPQSISLLKGLRIVGSMELLQSCGLPP